MSNGELILYTTEDGLASFQLRAAEGELREEATIKDYLIVRSEGALGRSQRSEPFVVRATCSRRQLVRNSYKFEVKAGGKSNASSPSGLVFSGIKA